MLQQTRVEAVIPLYERFLKRFPDLESLASASQDEVLSYWQGLGYYSRARRLHETAQILTAKHGGCIPNSKAELLALPGIGSYTAGALLSIAFSQPVTAVDGNLLRIGARLFLIYEPINKAAAKRRIQAEFDKLIPLSRPGDFNQALMDLGSRICIPKRPRCKKCPVKDYCKAFEEGKTFVLPIRQAPKPPTPMGVILYLVEAGEHILLRQRQTGEFLQGMWELPWFEKKTSPLQKQLSTAESWLISQLGTYNPIQIWETEYVFSHRHWMMTVYHYNIAQPFSLLQEDKVQYRWQPFVQFDVVALPTVFKKVLQQGIPNSKSVSSPT